MKFKNNYFYFLVLLAKYQQPQIGDNLMLEELHRQKYEKYIKKINHFIVKFETEFVQRNRLNPKVIRTIGNNLQKDEKFSIFLKSSQKKASAHKVKSKKHEKKKQISNVVMDFASKNSSTNVFQRKDNFKKCPNSAEPSKTDQKLKESNLDVEHVNVNNEIVEENDLINIHSRDNFIIDNHTLQTNDIAGQTDTDRNSFDKNDENDAQIVPAAAVSMPESQPFTLSITEASVCLRELLKLSYTYIERRKNGK